MQLYYTKGACSLACRIILNEIGIKPDYIAVDLKTKKTEAGKNFLEINPKGAVPTLVTDNHEVLTENTVILQYLADAAHSSQLLPEVGNFDRYQVLEWLNYVATEIHKSFALLFYPLFSDQQKNDLLVPIIRKKFDYVNSALKGMHFLYKDHFTLPDGYFFVMLLWARQFKFELQDWPELYRYFKELRERKAIQESLEQEKLPYKKD